VRTVKTASGGVGRYGGSCAPRGRGRGMSSRSGRPGVVPRWRFCSSCCLHRRVSTPGCVRHLQRGRIAGTAGNLLRSWLARPASLSRSARGRLASRGPLGSWAAH